MPTDGTAPPPPTAAADTMFLGVVPCADADLLSGASPQVCASPLCLPPSCLLPEGLPKEGLCSSPLFTWLGPGAAPGAWRGEATVGKAWEDGC